MIKITKSIIEAGGSVNGVGWTRKQCDAIGIPFPLVKGWRGRIIGTFVETERVELFLSLSQRQQPITISQAETFKPTPPFRRKAKKKSKKSKLSKEQKLWNKVQSNYSSDHYYMPYRAYLKTRYWKAVRSLVFHQRGKSCSRCKSTKRLQLHHLHYRLQRASLEPSFH